MIALEDVPDPVFSQKLMGEGIAIIPSARLLVSPIEGEVIQVFHTKHAIGIKSLAGLELLIHVGLETVELNGQGFEILVKQGKKVKVGDPLLKFDIAFLKEHNKDIVTPIIITNSADKIRSIEGSSGDTLQEDNCYFPVS